MHLKLSGKVILRKFSLSREFLWIFSYTGPKVPFPLMKPCKSAFIKDQFQISFHVVVDKRQGESNISQISTWKAFLLLN